MNSQIQPLLLSQLQQGDRRSSWRRTLCIRLACRSNQHLSRQKENKVFFFFRGLSLFCDHRRNGRPPTPAGQNYVFYPTHTRWRRLKNKSCGADVSGFVFLPSDSDRVVDNEQCIISKDWLESSLYSAVGVGFIPL